MKGKLIRLAVIAIALLIAVGIGSMLSSVYETGHTIAVEQDAVLFVDWVQHISVFTFYLYLGLLILVVNFISAVLFH